MPSAVGRVAEPQTLFNVHFHYDLNPLTMEVYTAGTGSVVKTSNVSSATLSTGGTAVTANAIIQSHAHYRYEPGKSQSISMTGVIGVYTQYVRKIIGYTNDYDGVFFDMDGTSTGANAGAATGKIAVTVRTSTSGSPPGAGADTQVLQPNWNLDRMDGTGPSGISLDFTKTQIFFINLQWLGVGRVRFGFNVNGILYYCHQVLNANVMTLPYMNSANGPLRWQIYNDSAHAAAGTAELTAICGTVISEGGSEAPQTLIFSADSGVTTRAISQVLIPAISIKPGLLFRGLPNRTIYKIVSGSVLNTGGTYLKWTLVYNGTLSGAMFSDFNTTYSAMQVNIAATAISGGVVIRRDMSRPRPKAGNST